MVLNLLEENVPDSIEQQLAALPHLNPNSLHELWQRVFSTTTIPSFRKSLMIRFLAYRMQEQCHGGLSKRSQQRVEDLVSTLAANPRAPLSPPPPIRAGTRLVRRWRDQVHVVNVNEESFEYRGSHYESLSEIARVITGSRRSGPLFFGIKQNNQSTEALE
jgi:hypothetical protein